MSRTALGAALSCLALALGGCGSDGEKPDAAGAIAWEKPPQVDRHPTLRQDRVLSGRVRNKSSREIVLIARNDLKLVDADGRAVPAAAIFLNGFGRDIYPPSYQRKIPEKDLLRLGLKARLGPGEARPLTLTWRVEKPDREPVRIETPGGALVLPTGG